MFVKRGSAVSKCGKQRDVGWYGGEIGSKRQYLEFSERRNAQIMSEGFDPGPLGMCFLFGIDIADSEY